MDAEEVQIETLIASTNDYLDQLHTDAQIAIASIWLLCGIVVGVAVGQLIYRLWRS